MNGSNVSEEEMKKHIQAERTAWFQRKKTKSITNFISQSSNATKNDVMHSKNVLIPEKTRQIAALIVFAYVT